MENASPDFREATDEELKAHSSGNQLVIKYGSYYTSLVIECKLFLPWALKKYVFIYSLKALTSKIVFNTPQIIFFLQFTFIPKSVSISNY